MIVFTTKQYIGGEVMTQLNFTINSDKFLEEVLQSDLKTATKGIITALLNQVMEAERDSYIQASAYERTGNRQDYRNGYYERDYTIKADTKSPQGAKNALW